MQLWNISHGLIFINHKNCYLFVRSDHTKNYHSRAFVVYCLNKGKKSGLLKPVMRSNSFVSILGATILNCKKKMRMFHPPPHEALMSNETDFFHAVFIARA